MFKSFYDIIFFLTAIVVSYSLKAQTCGTPSCGSPCYVCTPNGSLVKAELLGELTFQQRVSKDITDVANFPSVKVLYDVSNPSSTATYNCHGYAWHYTETGERKWLTHYLSSNNDTCVTRYMDDGSYIEVPYEPFPGKVWWVTGFSHSAVTTETPGIFISKWGNGPLVKHPWNVGWGANPILKYYVDSKDLVIVGSNNLCTPTKYKLNISPGQIDYWQLDPANGFSINSNDTVVIVTPPCNLNGQTTTLKAMMIRNGNHYVISKINIKAVAPTITGPVSICPDSTATFTAHNFPDTITWTSSFPSSMYSINENTITITNNYSLNPSNCIKPQLCD